MTFTEEFEQLLEDSDIMKMWYGTHREIIK